MGATRTPLAAWVSISSDPAGLWLRLPASPSFPDPAASAKLDSQVQMKRRTIIAALKQGMTPQTKITALCDGAGNCWNIIDALEPLAASVDRILDWFHLSMKIKYIASRISKTYIDTD